MGTERKRKILVLNNDSQLMTHLKKKFTQEECEFFQGLKGFKQLDAEGKGMPNLVILDTMLKEINALSFFKNLKADEDFAKIPVIALSPRGDMKEAYEQLGCDYFGEKPFNYEEIIETVAEFVVWRVLLFAPDVEMRINIKPCFAPHLYELVYSEDEKELFEKLKESRYQMGVFPYPLIGDTPEEFVFKVRETSKNPKIRVLAYGDDHIRGQEEVEELVVKAEQAKWSKAGAEYFYDSKIAKSGFSEYLSKNC